MTRISQFKNALDNIPEKLFQNMDINFGEITLTVSDKNYLSLMRFLRDDEKFSFDIMIDLCGVDYLSYEKNPNTEKRYAVVVHLLSTTRNWRMRVRVFAENNEEPKLPSIVNIWNCANWFEREAFDLFGIYFDDHPDLRRILTDYEFEGHPFRKDFPVQGYVEMHFDEKEGRVAYKPVSIDARESVPRIVRERGV